MALPAGVCAGEFVQNWILIVTKSLRGVLQPRWYTPRHIRLYSSVNLGRINWSDAQEVCVMKRLVIPAVFGLLVITAAWGELEQQDWLQRAQNPQPTRSTLVQGQDPA